MVVVVVATAVTAMAASLDKLIMDENYTMSARMYVNGEMNELCAPMVNAPQTTWKTEDDGRRRWWLYVDIALHGGSGDDVGSGGGGGTVLLSTFLLHSYYVRFILIQLARFCVCVCEWVKALSNFILATLSMSVRVCIISTSVMFHRIMIYVLRRYRLTHTFEWKIVRTAFKTKAKRKRRFIFLVECGAEMAIQLKRGKNSFAELKHATAHTQRDRLMRCIVCWTHCHLNSLKRKWIVDLSLMSACVVISAMGNVNRMNFDWVNRRTFQMDFWMILLQFW